MSRREGSVWETVGEILAYVIAYVLIVLVLPILLGVGARILKALYKYLLKIP